MFRLPLTLLVRPANTAGRTVFGLVLLALAGLPVTAAETGAVCAVPRPEMPDARAEGWTSEAFSELAQTELKRLLVPLADPEEEAAKVKGVFALRPAVSQAAKTAAVTVWRGGKAKPGAAQSLTQALATIRQLFQTGAELHLKVKTTGVNLPEKKAGTEARTTHLIHLDGPAAAGRRGVGALPRGARPPAARLLPRP